MSDPFLNYLKNTGEVGWLADMATNISKLLATTTHAYNFVFFSLNSKLKMATLSIPYKVTSIEEKQLYIRN